MLKQEISSLLAGLLGRKTTEHDPDRSFIDYPYLGQLTPSQLVELGGITGWTIDRPGLYERALTHRSFIAVKQELAIDSNERLEFLGDAVLDMVVSDYLFLHHQDLTEGTLSKFRSTIVNKDSLASCAKHIGLVNLILMSYGARRAMESGSDSILADAMEALIAAVYLDKGYRAAEEFVVSKVLPNLHGYIGGEDTNYKSQLLEKLQSESLPAPNYEVVMEKGPDHDKEFTVQAYVGDRPLATGTGKNKKTAEQDAARNSLEFLLKGLS